MNFRMQIGGRNTVLGLDCFAFTFFCARATLAASDAAGFRVARTVQTYGPDVDKRRIVLCAMRGT